MKIPDGWVKPPDSKSWYCHDELGGIYRECDGWYFYPMDKDESERVKCKTLKAAFEKASDAEKDEL